MVKTWSERVEAARRAVLTDRARAEAARSGKSAGLVTPDEFEGGALEVAHLSMLHALGLGVRCA